MSEYKLHTTGYWFVGFWIW